MTGVNAIRAILTNHTQNFVTPAKAGAHGATDPGLRREDDERTPRVTSVRCIPLPRMI